MQYYCRGMTRIPPLDDDTGCMSCVIEWNAFCSWPRYMAPEIWNNQEYDGRQIDIWSVGATLLVCLLGDYPWAAPTRVPMEAQGIYRRV